MCCRISSALGGRTELVSCEQVIAKSRSALLIVLIQLIQQCSFGWQSTGFWFPKDNIEDGLSPWMLFCGIQVITSQPLIERCCGIQLAAYKELVYVESDQEQPQGRKEEGNTLILRVSLSCTVVMSEGHRGTSFIQQYGLLLSIKLVSGFWGE